MRRFTIAADAPGVTGDSLRMSQGDWFKGVFKPAHSGAVFVGSATGDSAGAGTVIESVFGGGATSTVLEHPEATKSMSSSEFRSFRILNSRVQCHSYCANHEMSCFASAKGAGIHCAERPSRVSPSDSDPFSKNGRSAKPRREVPRRQISRLPASKGLPPHRC